MVSGSSDYTLKVWDLATGAELRTLSGHKGSVRAVAVTPDGRRVVSGSWDHTLKVWDLATGAELATMILDAPLLSVALTPDGATIIAGDSFGNLHCLHYHTPPPRA
jgi:WD40 repeat protein